MKLLAIECAGQNCSVALHIDGQTRQRLEHTSTQLHSQRILPMQQSLLAEAQLSLNQLDAIVCGHGPGSFTGVRVAVAVTQGLAYGANLPTLAVSSLAAIAWGAMQSGDYMQSLIALDARMGELYWGYYRKAAQGIEVALEQRLTAPETLCEAELSGLQNCLAVGDGWLQYAGKLTPVRERCMSVDSSYPQQASDVAGLAAELIRQDAERLVPAVKLQPVYLRNKVTG